MIRRIRKWYYKRYGEKPMCDRDGCSESAMGLNKGTGEYYCWSHEPTGLGPVRFVTWEDYEL